MDSPHKILAKVSEHKRDIEGDVLKQLVTYKSTLLQIIKKSKAQLLLLHKQREVLMEHGAVAFELLMLEQSLSEHEQRISEVGIEISALDMAIIQQKKKWADQHKKHKAHEKMQDQIKRKEKRNAEHKQQAALDDQFSSKVFANGRA